MRPAVPVAPVAGRRVLAARSEALAAAASSGGNGVGGSASGGMSSGDGLKSLRGMNDRELLAAAQLACDQQVWDRCINTSERTRSEFDLVTRFPLAFRREARRPFDHREVRDRAEHGQPAAPGHVHVEHERRRTPGAGERDRLRGVRGNRNS